MSTYGLLGVENVTSCHLLATPRIGVADVVAAITTGCVLPPTDASSQVSEYGQSKSLIAVPSIVRRLKRI